METTEKRGPGRPRKYSKPMAEHFAVRAMSKQLKRWRKTAKQANQDVGDWVRDILDAACPLDS